MADLFQHALEDSVRRKIRRPLFATLAGDHLAGLTSPTSAYQISGAMVLPLRQVLGLRPAIETKERELVVENRNVQLNFHDVRSYLDQVARLANTKTLEELHSPFVIIGGTEHDQLKRISQSFVNKHAYHDFLARIEPHRRKLAEPPPIPVRHLLEAARLCLTGVHVLTHAGFDSSLETLAERYDAPWIRAFLARQRAEGDAAVLDAEEVRLLEYDVSRLENMLHAAHARSQLPDAVGSIGALDEFLVDLRLRELTDSQPRQ